jgi:hypothetical protein
VHNLTKFNLFLFSTSEPTGKRSLLKTDCFTIKLWGHNVHNLTKFNLFLFSTSEPTGKRSLLKTDCFTIKPCLPAGRYGGLILFSKIFPRICR